MASATLYPDTEVRQPRESFTAKLRTICTRLDRLEAPTLTYPDRYEPGGKDTSTVTARALWVAGSYARGAPTCGDLDLIFDFDQSPGTYAPTTRASKALFGAFPGVRVFRGTPQLSSEFTFTEAVLVWQPRMDWAAALAGIALDPAAGHWPRAVDAIPLRLEQVDMDRRTAETLVAQRAQGRLEAIWRFKLGQP